MHTFQLQTKYTALTRYQHAMSFGRIYLICVHFKNQCYSRQCFQQFTRGAFHKPATKFAHCNTLILVLLLCVVIGYLERRAMKTDFACNIHVALTLIVCIFHGLHSLWMMYENQNKYNAKITYELIDLIVCRGYNHESSSASNCFRNKAQHLIQANCCTRFSTAYFTHHSCELSAVLSFAPSKIRHT